MVKRDVIVVGGSVGSLEVVRKLLAALPGDFRATLLVSLHSAPHGPALLAKVLDTSGPLPAEYAKDGDRILPGRVYVAPPDRHLVVEPGVLRLTRGPKENRFRPAVDTLFRSAAAVYGPRVVGVILSGGLDDGTAGFWAIKRLGGTTIVQHPAEAIAPSMPESAVEHVEIDYVALVAELPELLVRLAATDADEMGGYAVPKNMDIEVRIAKEENALEIGVKELGEPSIFACPECHGVLLQLEEGERVRFRCHTGHAYSIESLLAHIEDAVEDSLYSAIRAMEECILLMRHMADHLPREEARSVADALRNRAKAVQQRVNLARTVVLARDPKDAPPAAAESTP